MITNAYTDHAKAFIDLGRKVMDIGKEVEVRGKLTKELIGVPISIINPLNRCLLIPKRHDNIFAKIAETFWTIDGRDDIEWLSNYLPRAIDFSDDNKTWRGAYGPRLRTWNGSSNMVDQLAQCVELLNRDRTTRQAVMILFDPSEDFKPTKDVPCNNWAHWIIRDDMLHLNIAQRSSDLMWGFSGIDTYFWSVLQQMMAYWTNCKVGHLNYYITSLHIYQEHWDRMDKILQQADHPEYHTLYDTIDNNITPKFTTKFDELYDMSLTFFELEHYIQKYVVEYPEDVWIRITSLMWDEYVRICLQGLFVYWLAKSNTELAVSYLNKIPYCDYKLAYIEYETRNYPSMADNLKC